MTITEKQFIKLCMKYTKPLLILFNGQVFEVKNGKVILHFDNKNELKKIDSETIIYKKKKSCG